MRLLMHDAIDAQAKAPLNYVICGGADVSLPFEWSKSPYTAEDNTCAAIFTYAYTVNTYNPITDPVVVLQQTNQCRHHVRPTTSR